MNFNLIATLFAICASLTAAVTEGQQEKLAQAPPVRVGKKAGKHGDSSASRKHDISSSKCDGSSSRKHDSSSSKNDSSSSRKQDSSSSKHVSSKSKADSSSKSSKWTSCTSSSSTSCPSLSSSSRSTIPRSSSSLKFSSELHESSKECSRRLEAILYSPPSTVKDYMTKIANEMRLDMQVIMAAFSAGNLEYIRIYVNRYNILITVAGPFGLPVLVAPNFVAQTLPLMNVATAQTYSGRDGFYADSKNNYYNYEFSMMSSNGQYITFILSLPLSAMTNSPTVC